jgi:hypothetical protein
LALIPSLLATAQEWELKKFSEGINVYTAPIVGSDFKAFKAEMEITATVEQMRYILEHPDLFPDMFPDTEELNVLSRPNDSTSIQYNLTSTPWPLDDRDGAYKSVFVTNKSGGFVLKGEAIPDYIPEKEDVVRIKKSDSKWEVIPLKDGKLKVIYEVRAEPGGKLPEWLVNSAVVDVPYQTFVNLKKVLKTL